jgi:hypothetical protein
MGLRIGSAVMVRDIATDRESSKISAKRFIRELMIIILINQENLLYHM